MMDERLIGEVQRHAIIYNRQKTSLFNGDKCANKEMAWLKIAHTLGTDADTCKKRWKYLRERYVQQKKTGDTQHSYEHLSRPYLEKMRFLDTFIQPRKSYRNAVGLLVAGSPARNTSQTSSAHPKHQLHQLHNSNDSMMTTLSNGCRSSSNGSSSNGHPHQRHGNSNNNNMHHQHSLHSQYLNEQQHSIRQLLSAADADLSGMMMQSMLTDAAASGSNGNNNNNTTDSHQHQQQLQFSHMLDQFHSQMQKQNAPQYGQQNGQQHDPAMSNENLKLFDQFNSYVQQQQQHQHQLNDTFGDAAGPGNGYQNHLTPPSSQQQPSSANLIPARRAENPALLTTLSDSPDAQLSSLNGDATELLAEHIKNELIVPVAISDAVDEALAIETVGTTTPATTVNDGSKMQQASQPPASCAEMITDIPTTKPSKTTTSNGENSLLQAISPPTLLEDASHSSVAGRGQKRPPATSSTASSQHRLRHVTDDDEYHLGDESSDEDEDDEDDTEDDGPSMKRPRQSAGRSGQSGQTTNHNGTSNGAGSSSFASQFLYPFYQQMQQSRVPKFHSAAASSQMQQHPFQQQQNHNIPHQSPPTTRSSEQLLGELVTAELLKMSRERRRAAQKKILEVLFFGD